MMLHGNTMPNLFCMYNSIPPPQLPNLLMTKYTTPSIRNTTRHKCTPRTPYILFPGPCLSPRSHFFPGAECLRRSGVFPAAAAAAAPTPLDFAGSTPLFVAPPTALPAASSKVSCRPSEVAQKPTKQSKSQQTSRTHTRTLARKQSRTSTHANALPTPHRIRT